MTDIYDYEDEAYEKSALEEAMDDIRAETIRAVRGW